VSASGVKPFGIGQGGGIPLKSLYIFTGIDGMGGKEPLDHGFFSMADQTEEEHRHQAETVFSLDNGMLHGLFTVVHRIQLLVNRHDLYNLGVMVVGMGMVIAIIAHVVKYLFLKVNLFWS